MSAPFTYAEAKSVLIEVLKRDVALHEAKHYFELGANFDEIDERLPRNAGVEFSKLIFAFEFWAGWQDSAEHGWLFYEPIHENDWPRFAKTLIENLSTDRETTDSILLKHFAPRPKKPSLLSRIKNFFQTERQE